MGGQRAIDSLVLEALEELWAKSNGFFEFDKGEPERSDRAASSRLTNARIRNMYAREALAFLESQGGDVAETYRQLASARRRDNLAQRVQILQERLSETFAAFD